MWLDGHLLMHGRPNGVVLAAMTEPGESAERAHALEGLAMTHAVHPQHFHPHSHSSQLKVASGLNVVAGIYLIISAWIGALSGGTRANGIIFGIIVAILAAIRFSGGTGRWMSWLNALIGIWLIISPWVYGTAGQGWMWNSIVLGIIVLVLGACAAMASGSEGPGTESAPR